MLLVNYLFKCFITINYFIISFCAAKGSTTMDFTIDFIIIPIVCALYILSNKFVCALYILSNKFVCALYILSNKFVCALYILSNKFKFTLYLSCTRCGKITEARYYSGCYIALTHVHALSNELHVLSTQIHVLCTQIHALFTQLHVLSTQLRS